MWYYVGCCRKQNLRRYVGGHGVASSSLASPNRLLFPHVENLYLDISAGVGLTGEPCIARR